MHVVGKNCWEVTVLKKLLVMLLILAMMSMTVTGVYAKGCGPKNGKVTGGGQIAIPGGKASFGFNAMKFSRDDGPKGELQYIDHVSGIKVHAHELEELYVAEYLEGNKPYPMRISRFEGPCTVNNEDGYWVIVWVVDQGEPGKMDQFYIDVTGPGDYHYENPQGVDVTIISGNIQIHKPPK